MDTALTPPVEFSEKTLITIAMLSEHGACSEALQRIGSSGDSAKITAAGNHSVGKVGENGCLALAWLDEKAQRPRLAVGYVGEGLKTETWYTVKGGQFVEVEGGK